MAYTLLAPRKGRRFWTVRIRLPGKRSKELGTSCERKTDARAVAERLHTEAATESYRVTLLEAVEALIGLRVRQKRSAATLEKLDQKGAALVGLLGEERNIATLELRDTEAYSTRRRAMGVSDSTIAMELTVLTSALAYQARHGKYPKDPKALWPAEIAHGSGPPRKRWLPWEEYLRVLMAIDSEFRDAFVMYCATGMRLGELYKLTAAHAVGRLLNVPGTKTESADRILPLNGDALEVMGRRRGETPRGALWPIARPNWEAQEVAWHRALTAACEGAKVEHASTNDLRRTFCSWCWQQGVDEALVIKWMGHKSSRMVREVYAQPSQEQHEREGDKIPSRRRVPVEDAPQARETKRGT